MGTEHHKFAADDLGLFTHLLFKSTAHRFRNWAPVAGQFLNTYLSLGYVFNSIHCLWYLKVQLSWSMLLNNKNNFWNLFNIIFQHNNIEINSRYTSWTHCVNISLYSHHYPLWHLVITVAHIVTIVLDAFLYRNSLSLSITTQLLSTQSFLNWLLYKMYYYICRNLYFI